MIVINEQTRKRTHLFKTIRGIVYKDDNYIEFGYFIPTIDTLRTEYNGKMYYDIRKDLKVMEVFSKLEGTKKCFLEEDTAKIETHLNVFGNGRFPYSIAREYEAEHYIDMFEEKVEEQSSINYPYSKDVKYSFGIEFETAAGYLPENKCFDLGLIPLRDGSISGIEYSTIPLYGNEGLNLLKRQLDCLKEYTYTNKECSTHIHFGGYPVEEKAIYILYKLWYYIQYNILDYIPTWSYSTGNFKKNEKSYCDTVPDFDDLKNLYRFYACQSYMGDLYQPHPCDIEKRAKWNIKTRYYNCNFINMLCYNAAKTVEFRFLTPTYSFEKLSTFILMFNAILKKAESIYKEYKDKSYTAINGYFYTKCDEGLLDIKHIVKEVCDNTTSDYVLNNMKKLIWLKQTQQNVGDYNGGRLDIENRYFPDGKQED